MTWVVFFDDHAERMINGEGEATTETEGIVGMTTHATGLSTPEEVMQLPEMNRPLLGSVGAGMPSRGELDASVQLTEHYVFARYPEE